MKKMLPPHELKNKSFSRAMRGYNPVEVDEYVEFLIEKYTELYRENDELERKLKLSVTKLEEIKNDEDSIRGALIDAKRTAAKIKSEAEERAEAIIRSAKTSCNSILSDFNEKIEEGRDTLALLKRDAVELKSELFTRYGEHIRYIDKLTDGIDVSDIPDSDTLRKKAVNSLKENIADIYKAAPQSDIHEEHIPTEETAPEASSAMSAAAFAAGSADESAAGENNPEPEVYDEEQTPEDTIEFNKTPDDEENTDTAPVVESDETSYSPKDDDDGIIFDKILGKPASENIESDNEQSLIVNREPLTTKSSNSGLKGSIRELNKRYKESEDIVNTPDSDLEEDANYLDFVKTVTGKDTPSSSGKDADFDLLFSESKSKKKK